MRDAGGNHSQAKLEPTRQENATPWTAARVNDTVCLASGRSLASCDRVFFLHMRKAAGTSMRALLESIGKRRGIEIDTQEGGILHQPRMGGARTFRITCLRDPLERVFSLYNFQGRWPRADQDKDPEQATPFAEWLNTIPTPRTWRLWDESADYYAKTLSGGPLDQRGIAVNERRLALARAVLERFDLVLILERLGDPAYDAWWSRRLGLPHPKRLPWHRKTRRKQNKYDIRDHITDDQRAEVVARNRFDIALYQYARERFAPPQERFATTLPSPANDGADRK